MLRSLTYPFDSSEEGSLNGTITRDGTRVDAIFRAWPEQTLLGSKPGVSGIDLTIEISVGRDVRPSQTNEAKRWTDASPGMIFSPHLGRTVTLRQSIDLFDGADPQQVRKALDKFWREGKAYAARNGGRFEPAKTFDWTRVALSDGLILDSTDLASIDRMLASWRLMPTVPLARSDAVDGECMRVSGTPVVIGDSPSGKGPRDRTLAFVGHIALPNGEDAFTWSLAQSKVPYWAGTGATLRNPVEMMHVVDLSKGVSLGELRRQLFDFAAKLRALQAKANGTG